MCQREPVPFGRKRTDDLVQYRNRDLGELTRPGPMLFENRARQRKERVDTLQRGILVTGIRRKLLRRNAGEQLYVQVPCRCPVRVAGCKVRSQKAQVELQSLQSPLLQKVTQLHGDGVNPLASSQHATGLRRQYSHLQPLNLPR